MNNIQHFKVSNQNRMIYNFKEDKMLFKKGKIKLEKNKEDWNNIRKN